MAPPSSAPLAGAQALLRDLAVAAVVGVLAGAAAALFLVALDAVTATRTDHPWLVALLPAFGFAIGWAYLRWGAGLGAGTDRILGEIHRAQEPLPFRLVPMILLSTLATHLGGGSAGREGTAVQMGGGLADQIARIFRLDPAGRRLALIAGLSGGFGAVFGTPLAGTIFGLEVLALGLVRIEALLPCLVAAVVGDRVVALLGVHHTPWALTEAVPAGAEGLLAAAALGVAAGLVARLYLGTTRAIAERAGVLVPWLPARLAAGGVLVALAALALGSTRHLGLGLPLGLEAFTTALPASDLALKLVLTAVTLGFGFKGGEVTPLFVMGACLGSTLAPWLPLPVGVLAALGFVAVFAGAAKTPLACLVMAGELFGSGIGVLAAIACFVSARVVGPEGLYRGPPAAGSEA